MAKDSTGTYVYCVVARPRVPKLTRVAAGPPGAGRVRLLEVDREGRSKDREGRSKDREGRSKDRPLPASNLYLVVADVPLARYGEAAIQRGLSNLDWVSRAAVAHEAVIESFIDAAAVLPMKLFTIFNSDERALAHMRADRPRIDALVKRLANHHEWGIRVVLDRTRAIEAARPARTHASIVTGRSAGSGAAYLSRKKVQRDVSIELATRARDTVDALYDRLAAASRSARRRVATELPAQGGSLLLDAAFLVKRSRSKTFQALAAREARALSRGGYGLTLSGPWPPYTFVQD